MGAGSKMPYSEAELKLLMSGASYDEFNAVFPGRRTRDAWRNKRQDLGIAGKGIDPDPDATMEAVEAFINRRTPMVDLAREFDVDPQSDDDWEKLFDHLENAAEQRGTLGESTKAVAWRSPVDGPIGIAFFSDLHAGASGVLYKRFRSDMELLVGTDGLYGIFNGDAMENAKHMSKAGNALYSSLFASPREQLEYVKRRAMIAKGKWIVWTGGNHDSRDYMTGGIDRLPDMCRELDVPYATEAGATVTAMVGNQTYTIVVKHDYRGKSQINKSNSGRRLWDEWSHADYNADVVALAHLHEPDQHETTRKGSPVYYLRSGTYKVRDEWAESAGYKPSYGVPIVILYPDERAIQPVTDFERGVRILQTERQSWAKSRHVDIY